MPWRKILGVFKRSLNHYQNYHLGIDPASNRVNHPFSKWDKLHTSFMGECVVENSVELIEAL